MIFQSRCGYSSALRLGEAPISPTTNACPGNGCLAKCKYFGSYSMSFLLHESLFLIVTPYEKSKRL
jgi:hypothetical protein